MKLRTVRIALTLAVSAVASAQIACSSSEQATDSGGGATSGGSPATVNGGTGNGTAGALAAAGSGNVAGIGAGGTTPGGAGSSALGGTAGTSSGGSVGNNGGGGTGGGQANSGVAFDSGRVVVTGVRGTTTPAAASVLKLHNGGQAPVQITSLALSGANSSLFHVTSPSTLPATLGPDADLPVTLELTTTGASVPAAPSNKDLGSVLLTATLTAMSSAGAASANAFGLVLTQANYEPMLGQILTTLGYPVNVGKAQNNWNPNTSMDATNLPGVEAGTDEVAASHFVKSGPGNVSMVLVARFSPVGALPYGWYTATTGCSAGCTTVGTMAMVSDAQTSDKARMVYPPLAAGSATEFDTGSAPFGIWVNSDQKTQKFKEGGNMVNGDWDYSQDALNSPANANVHRFKSYPLKDAAGASVPQSYLVAVEEAGNGDYQDYVFVLSNVTAMP